MATIHRILDVARRTTGLLIRQPAQDKPAQSAEIILFPGVRYERWSELHSHSAPIQSRGKRRDRLDIAE